MYYICITKAIGMNTQEKKLTSIRLNKKLYLYLQQRAKAENRSLNNYIETLLFEASDFNLLNEESRNAVFQAMEEREQLTKMKEGESTQDFMERLLED